MLSEQSTFPTDMVSRSYCKAKCGSVLAKPTSQLTQTRKDSESSEVFFRTVIEYVWLKDQIKSVKTGHMMNSDILMNVLNSEASYFTGRCYIPSEASSASMSLKNINKSTPSAIVKWFCWIQSNSLSGDRGVQPCGTWSCKCLGFHVTTSIPFKMPPRKNLVSCSWTEFGKCTHFKHFPNYAGISSRNVVSSVKSWKNMKMTNVRKQRDNGFALVTGKELFLLYQFLKPKSSFNEKKQEHTRHWQMLPCTNIRMH